MKTWGATLSGTGRRQNILRAALALAFLGGVLWALPVRRAGEDGGHHGGHAAPEEGLDAFERAGLVELEAGQRGPAFRLVQLDGGHASPDTWKDKLVLLNFWATWCTPCTVEMPALEAVWRRYRGRGLVVVGVSVDRGAPRALIEPYVTNLGLTFPILLDPDMATAQAWRVTGLPATFVIRPGGEAVAMAIGAREWDAAPVRALLEPMLPGAPH
ncbi:MAG: TlpA family protein disulfide reductase [Candidatus Rokuibacteriota bacterium]